jgi:hypothetical protein
LICRRFKRFYRVGSWVWICHDAELLRSTTAGSGINGSFRAGIHLDSER